VPDGLRVVGVVVVVTDVVVADVNESASLTLGELHMRPGRQGPVGDDGAGLAGAHRLGKGLGSSGGPSAAPAPWADYGPPGLITD
jgi:hypothetical protein